MRGIGWRMGGANVICILLRIAVADARADSFAFSSDVQGFRVVDFPFRSHFPDPATVAAVFDGGFGNPGGSIAIVDVYNETGLAAPFTHPGNLNWAYGQTIRYDLHVTLSDGIPYPTVALNCGMDTLYFQRESPALNTWTTMSVSLSEAGWQLGSDPSTPVTRSVFTKLLSNVKGIYFATEWNTGPDNAHVDNVVYPHVYRSGDGDLNGTVGFADLLTLAKNYNTSPGGLPNVTWAKGDFDGNNKVDFGDLLALAKNYNRSEAAGETSASFAADWARAQSLVPEPMSIVCGTGTVLLLGRRRSAAGRSMR